MARKLIGHRDYEAPLPDLLKTLKIKSGCIISHIEYRDVLAFPLSGGSVGKELIPHIEWLENLIPSFDHFLTKALLLLGMEKHFCWQYLVVARKT